MGLSGPWLDLRGVWLRLRRLRAVDHSQDDRAGSGAATKSRSSGAYRAKTSMASSGCDPTPRTWSALEYACHTRDGFALYETRVGVVLIEDRPLLPRMRRDELVVERLQRSGPLRRG